MTLRMTDMDTATSSTLTWPSVPNYFDNDIITKAKLILVHCDSNASEQEDNDTLLRAITVALQIERNAWKERLQDALHAIDKQHRSSLAIETALQDISNNLGMQINEEESQIKRTVATVQFIKQYIQEATSLQQQIQTMQACTEDTVAKLRIKMKYLEEENSKVKEELKYKTTSISRLRAELSSFKKQLQITKLQLEPRRNKKLSPISLTESKNDKPDEDNTHANNIYSGRSNAKFTTKGIKKSNHVHNIYTQKDIVPISEGGDSVKVVMQCLRCNHFFKRGDNNSRACLFHSQGKQIKEVCDSAGRLIKVSYVWPCCKRDADAPGCTYGHHY
ncbi:hypothetical protein Btru_024057 [Bulinus truncatus]|nr:hypothetical protein Btru_024057 [Bulinus truncatus]